MSYRGMETNGTQKNDISKGLNLKSYCGKRTFTVLTPNLSKIAFYVKSVCGNDRGDIYELGALSGIVFSQLLNWIRIILLTCYHS